jgi:alpha-1,3-rhamnosyltransferase
MNSACQRRFSRVVFKTQNNKGVWETLNNLIGESRGEYVYIIASDDLAAMHGVETAVNFLNQNVSYGLAVGNSEIIDKNGKRIYYDANYKLIHDEKEAAYKTFADLYRRHRPDVDFLADSFGSYKSLLHGNYIPNGYLVRKAVFDKKDFFTKDAPMEDYRLMLQISKSYKMKYIDEILFYYRMHDDNTISNKEKMDSNTRLTFRYEMQAVFNGNNEHLKKLFSDELKRIIKKKVKINIFGVFVFYVSYSIMAREEHLVCFGRDFVCRKKKFLY